MYKLQKLLNRLTEILIAYATLEQAWTQSKQTNL